MHIDFAYHACRFGAESDAAGAAFGKTISDNDILGGTANAKSVLGSSCLEREAVVTACQGAVFNQDIAGRFDVDAVGASTITVYSTATDDDRVAIDGSDVPEERLLKFHAFEQHVVAKNRREEHRQEDAVGIELQQRVVGKQFGPKHGGGKGRAIELAFLDGALQVDKILDHEAIHPTGIDLVLLARSDEAGEGLAIGIEACARHGNVPGIVGIDQGTEGIEFHTLVACEDGGLVVLYLVGEVDAGACFEVQVDVVAQRDASRLPVAGRYDDVASTALCQLVDGSLDVALGLADTDRALGKCGTLELRHPFEGGTDGRNLSWADLGSYFFGSRYLFGDLRRGDLSKQEEGKEKTFHGEKKI